MDTMDIRFGFLFNFSSKCFVTDCTVYQRLHECTQTKRQRQVRTCSPNSPHFCFQQCYSRTDQTYSVVSELTCFGAICSFLAPGGFKVEVVVDVSHIKPRLWRKKRRVGSEQLTKISSRNDL